MTTVLSGGRPSSCKQGDRSHRTQKRSERRSRAFRVTERDVASWRGQGAVSKAGVETGRGADLARIEVHLGVGPGSLHVLRADDGGEEGVVPVGGETQIVQRRPHAGLGGNGGQHHRDPVGAKSLEEATSAAELAGRAVGDRLGVNSLLALGETPARLGAGFARSLWRGKGSLGDT